MQPEPTEPNAATEPAAGDAGPGGPGADGADPGRPPHPLPTIDLSGALHEAGHEVADLGWEGIPDSGPVLHADSDDDVGPADPLDFVNVQMPTD